MIPNAAKMKSLVRMGFVLLCRARSPIRISFVPAWLLPIWWRILQRPYNLIRADLLGEWLVVRQHPEGADPGQADLAGADLRQANLAGAHLDGADIHGSPPYPTSTGWPALRLKIAGGRLRVEGDARRLGPRRCRRKMFGHRTFSWQVLQGGARTDLVVPIRQRESAANARAGPSRVWRRSRCLISSSGGSSNKPSGTPSRLAD